MKITLIMLFLGIAIYGIFAYVIILVIKALQKYLKASEVRKEKADVKKH